MTTGSRHRRCTALLLDATASSPVPVDRQAGRFRLIAPGTPRPVPADRYPGAARADHRERTMIRLAEQVEQLAIDAASPARSAAPRSARLQRRVQGVRTLSSVLRAPRLLCRMLFAAPSANQIASSAKCMPVRRNLVALSAAIGSVRAAPCHRRWIPLAQDVPVEVLVIDDRRWPGPFVGQIHVDAPDDRSFAVATIPAQQYLPQEEVAPPDRPRTRRSTHRMRRRSPRRTADLLTVDEAVRGTYGEQLDSSDIRTPASARSGVG